MKFIDFNVDKRTQTGNSPARQLRRDGMVPAVIYGPGKTSEKLSVNGHELEMLLKKSRSVQMLLNLKVEGGETRPAMLKELQRNPVTHEMLHVDFYEIDPTRKIKVHVPVEPKGKAHGVEMGGMLQVIRRELEVLCLPGEIPEVIEIDVTELEIGGSIHVQDIPVDGGVEIPADVNFTVITCLGKKAEEAAEGEEGAEEAEEEAGEAAE